MHARQRRVGAAQGRGSTRRGRGTEGGGALQDAVTPRHFCRGGCAEAVGRLWARAGIYEAGCTSPAGPARERYAPVGFFADAPGAMSPDAPRPATQVYVADRHPAIHEALRPRIRRHPALRMQGTSTASEEARAAIVEQAPDVAVLALSLGGIDGLALIQHLQAHAASVQILIFSRYDERLYAERALQAGAAGYIMKTEALGAVVRAIVRVGRGEVALSRSMAARLLSRLVREDGGSPSAVAALTDREVTVFRKIGEGHSVRQIARQLGVHRKTIETHRRRAKKKLGHSTLEALVRHAVQWVRCGAQAAEASSGGLH